MVKRYTFDSDEQKSGRDAAFSVTQVNEYIRMLLDSNRVLGDIWVRGEISNFSVHYRTGHCYFSLKDDGGLIRAVMFGSQAEGLTFTPEDGMKVLLHGRVSSYVRDGQYQIYVKEIIPDGVGSLSAAFEQLKKKLAAEGLFDADLKKPMPKLPKTVGVITSPDGAAVRDIINVTGRRFPMARLIIFPSPVQGADAAKYLASGIRYFNNVKENPTLGVDVIIIGRGGGSMEDLWAFNDENLARTIAASEIPVISAVGHEVDFTVCDFVSDLRAPTPSAAAELCVPDASDLKKRITSMYSAMDISIEKRISRERDRVEALAKTRVLTAPDATYAQWRQTIDRLSISIDRAVDLRLEACGRDVKNISFRLNALSPLGVLSRGYTITENTDGKVLDTKEGIKVGDALNIKFRDGDVKATVTDTN